MAALTEAIGIDTIFGYAPIIYQKAGFADPSAAIAATAATNLEQALSALFIMVFIDRSRRKILLSWGLFLAGFMLLLLSLAFWLLAGSAALPWVVLVLMILLSAGYTFYFISVAWVVITEIFHPNVRPLGLALATVISYVFIVILSQFYLDLARVLSLGGLFFLFSCICFASIYFVTKILVETKDIKHVRL